MNIQDFKTDQKLELEGTWVPIDPETKLLIARANNKNYMNSLQRQIKENGYTHAARTGKVPSEIMGKFAVRAIAETVLLGWEGLKDGKKTPKYSVDEAERLMNESPDFLSYVVSLANDITNFQEAVEEEAIKN